MKKIFVILVLLSSLLFVYSSCKDEEDNDNTDVYSSKLMEGNYQFCWDCDNFNDTNVYYNSILLKHVTDTSFRLDRYTSSQPQISILNKEGAYFYEEFEVGGGILKPYWIKGVIKYIKADNPYLSDYYYELRGIYCSNTNFTDTIGTFYARQKTRTPQLIK